MPRKGRRRSAAQVRQLESVQKRRWASPGEAEKIAEEYRRTSTEEFERERVKAEREIEESRRKLRESELRIEGYKKECARLKEEEKELRHILRQLKSRESRGPERISNVLDPDLITALANPGKRLLPLGRHVEGRAFESANELAFNSIFPPSVIAATVGSVSEATVDAGYDDLVDDPDVDMGEHNEFDQHGGSPDPVPDAAVAGPSNAVAFSLEGPSGEEGV